MNMVDVYYVRLAKFILILTMLFVSTAQKIVKFVCCKHTKNYGILIKIFYKHLESDELSKLFDLTPYQVLDMIYPE